MKRESFEVAKIQISNYLHDNEIGAYTAFDIGNIFRSKKEEWKIASYRNVYDFIDFIINSKIVELVKLIHLTKGTIKQVFIIPSTDKFNIGQAIKKEGYISYYSAMQIHQLTLQNPKTIYVSFDKCDGYENSDHILQESIDNAFSKPQRQTSEIYKSEITEHRYTFIQKKSRSANVGIIENKGLKYTDLERTLIDIVIRPAYSGGVFEVLEAFINAKNDINLSRLISYLDQLDYVYPYYQLIGFYLEKAGFNEFETSLFYEKKTDLKFYLTYNISNKKFNEKWNIYFPNGF